MTLSRLIKQHPFWSVAIMEVVVVIVYLTAGTSAYFLKLSNMAVIGLANLCLTVIVIAVLTTQKWWPTIGFRTPDRRGDLLFFLIPLVPMALNLIPGVQVDSFLYVAEVFAITLMVGFTEETIFRGLMLNALKDRGPWKAALITASLFGLTHALNALAGKSLVDATFQIFYAVAVGFAYAALALKKGILWPLVLTHFLTDFIYFIQKPGFSLPSSWQSLMIVGLAIGFSAYGIYVMRHKSQEMAACMWETEQLVQPS